MKQINLILFALIFSISTSISLAEIDPEDKFLLEKLRERLLSLGDDSDLELHEYTINWLKRSPDILLLNWLEFAERDLGKTEENLRKTLEWRFKNKVDDLAHYSPPNNLGERLPFTYTGNTYDGHPVIYAQMGLWDARAVVQSGNQRDLIKRFISMLEKAMYEIEVHNNKTGSEEGKVGKFYGIIDMDQFALRQVTSIRVLGTLSNTLKIAEPNYPLFARQIFIIKAPTFFSVIVGLLKNVLSEKVVGNLYVHGIESTHWKEDIERVIPLKAIPSNLGGQFTLD